jgi:hypothetical protein
LRFLPKLGLAITIGLIAATATYATDVFTDPVGFITLTAVGTNGITGNALSFLGLGMTQVAISRGVVGTPTTNQVPVSDSTITAGQLAGTAEGPLYFIEITSGTVVGLMDDVIASDGAGNVYTANNNASLIAAGATYKIYPHWTFSNLFGQHNSVGLQGGTSAGAADVINVPVQSKQGYAQYYYYTGTKHAGGPNWEDANNNDATNVRIWIDQGILVQRVVGTNLTFQLVGGVKLGNSSIPIGPTNSFIGNVFASSSNTLKTCGLYTGVAGTGLVGGTSAGSADNVTIHNDATGKYAQYYYYTGTKHAGGPNWEDANNNDATNVQIPLGACVEIQLETGVGHNGFQWEAPAPY